MKNYFLSLFQQIFTMSFGLFISMYLSRTLGIDNYGYYTYLLTVANLFILFARFGINNYGPKYIVQKRASNSFSDIMNFQILTLLITCVVFIFFSFVFEELEYSITLLLFIIFSTLNVSWYYTAKGEFSFVNIVNTPVQILTFVFMLLLIDSSNDVLIALIVTTFFTFVNSLILYFKIYKNEKISYNTSYIKNNYKENFYLFLPFVLISIYTILDKLMLSNLSTYSELSIFSNSIILLKTSLIFITALIPVLMPKIASSIDDNNMVSKTMNGSIQFAIIVSFMLMAMFLTSSENIVTILYGSAYLKMVPLLMLTSPIILLCSISSIIAGQFFVSSNNTKIFTIIVGIGALINITLNLILIPHFDSFGAMFATIITEVFVTMLSIYFTRHIISISKLIKNLFLSIIPFVLSIIIILKVNIELANILEIVFNTLVIMGVFAVFFYIIFKNRKEGK